MSRPRIAHPRKSARQSERQDWPAIVYISVFTLAIAGYAVGRVVLDGKPHPYHWLIALASALAGIPIGWLWYRWRGDVF